MERQGLVGPEGATEENNSLAAAKVSDAIGASVSDGASHEVSVEAAKKVFMKPIDTRSFNCYDVWSIFLC